MLDPPDGTTNVQVTALATAVETTVGDARYPLMLLQRVITVSLETMKIVRGLPRLDFNTLS